MTQTIVKYSQLEGVIVFVETLITNLIKYEESNLMFYVDNDVEQRLVSHEN